MGLSFSVAPGFSKETERNTEAILEGPLTMIFSFSESYAISTLRLTIGVHPE